MRGSPSTCSTRRATTISAQWDFRGHLPHLDRGRQRGDGARRRQGREEQTSKLFEVCRLRDVPIITFVNKLDREARHPFDLLDEIEQGLALDVTPASWLIGMGRDFLGTYDLFADALLLFERGIRDRVEVSSSMADDAPPGNDAELIRAVTALGGVDCPCAEEASDSTQHRGNSEGLVEERGVPLTSFGDRLLSERTHHDDRDALVRRLGGHRAQHFTATEYGHHEVQQDHPGFFLR